MTQTFEEFQATKNLPNWRVVDRHTGNQIGKPMGLNAAHRKANHLDMQYGAVRYGVDRIA
jgi:hypothetical protein